MNKKELRKIVFDKYDGHCAYCGCRLVITDMQIDHINSKYRSKISGNEVDNSISNYNPSCRMCNFYKGVSNIEEFRYKLQSILQNSISKPFQFRMGQKYGMVSVNEWDGVFYFEVYRNSNTSINLDSFTQRS